MYVFVIEKHDYALQEIFEETVQMIQLKYHKSERTYT